MKSVMLALTFLFLSALPCFAKAENLLSDQTINDVIQLKNSVDTYAQDLWEEAKQHGSERRDYFKKLINSTSVISDNLELLLSVLGSPDFMFKEEKQVNLNSKEIYKLIDYMIARIDAMVGELDGLFQSTNDALIIHYTGKMNLLFKEGKQLLEQIQAELGKL